MVQYPAWTPKENILPTLDTALVFVGDENGTRGDYLALRVDKATRDACDHSALSAAGDFEDELSTTGGLYPTSIEGGSVHAEEEPCRYGIRGATTCVVELHAS